MPYPLHAPRLYVGLHRTPQVEGLADYVINQITFTTSKGRVWGPWGGNSAVGRNFSGSPVGVANITAAVLRYRSGNQSTATRFFDSYETAAGADYYGFMLSSTFVWQVQVGPR